MNHQRTSCITLVTTLLVALVSLLTATAASASPFLHDQTHISAITQSTGQAVLSHQPILDRASRQRAPTYDESATGARLADGDNVTGGVAQVLRTPSGALSHAYDLATNNAAAPWSQPSQATAHYSREPIGSSSVDKAAPSVVALSVAAEGDVPASTPTGVRGSPMDVPAGTNSPTVVNGISYSGHAIDEMQSEGFVPSVVQDAIENGQETIGQSGRVAYYSSENNITVITENGRVITVSSGFLKVR
jgi:hypothetical protein